jgi:hypothetical protein
MPPTRSSDCPRETLSEADLRPIFEKVTLPEATAGA